jgi:hypothetical protein
MEQGRVKNQPEVGMKSGYILCLFFLLLLCRSEISGQILSPVLKKGEFEAGCTYKWFRRESEPEYIMRFGWSYGSLFARYGITNCFTVSAEGLVGKFQDERHPERDYRHYVIGIGIGCRILQFKGYRFSFLLHYVDWFSFDRSKKMYHQDHRSVICALQFCKSILFNRQEIMLWTAPAYIYDESIHYLPDQYYVENKYKSINNYGIAFGFNLLLLRHIASFVHIVYADYFQPRIGVSYQFR